MVVQHAWDIMALFLIASMTTSESIKRKPQPEATEATAVPRPTGHSTAYAGGGASKQNHGGRKPNFATSSIAQVPRQPSEATESTIG